jgi:succinyl-CoA synthetase alpha subunit
VLFAARVHQDAIIEAIEAGIGLALVITEGVPVHDATVA